MTGLPGEIYGSFRHSNNAAMRCRLLSVEEVIHWKLRGPAVQQIEPKDRWWGGEMTIFLVPKLRDCVKTLGKVFWA